jgi:ribonuclease I
MNTKLPKFIIAAFSLFSAPHLASAKSLRQAKVADERKYDKLMVSATSGQTQTSFDFYVLSMSFQPEFCYMVSFNCALNLTIITVPSLVCHFSPLL